MIALVWKPCRSGAREIGYLGDVEVGAVRIEHQKQFRAVWTCTLLPYPSDQTARRTASIASAKCELAAYVDDWIKRAGLLKLPSAGGTDG